MSVNAGGYSGARAQSRLLAAVNARLEEISFRTGLITAMIALLALAAIATAGVFAATLSLGGTAVAAQGAPTTAAAQGAPTTASAPKTVPATTAAAQPTRPAHPRATIAPQATHPVTAATMRPQSTTGSQPWTEADGSQSSSRYYGRASFGNHGSWYGGHGSGYGGWPVHGGPGFPGQGFGSGYGGWPVHGGPGFPGQGFGSGPRGFGRP